MKLIFVLLFSFIITHCFSQYISKKKIEEIFCEDEDFEISKNELLDSLINHDFSSIWLTEQEPIGFIGNNYQRLFIHFNSFLKCYNSQRKYQVIGKTKVRNNVCDFHGEIELISIRLLNEGLRLVLNNQAKIYEDHEAYKRTKYPIYILIAKCTIYEDQSQKFSGIFSGYLKSTFFIKDEQLILNDLDKKFSDSYSNNQFVGSWQMYNSDTKKMCNWGLSRIPCSNNLDVGTGFFSPNIKYLKNGWDNYYKAYIEQNKAALMKEHQKWWED
jgi:hypothetical protein